MRRRPKFEETREADGPVAAMIRRVATAARKRNSQLGLFDADAIVHVLLEELGAELLDKGRLQLPGFGVFTVRARKARLLTRLFGAEARIELEARRTVHFAPAKSLRAKLKAGS